MMGQKPDAKLTPKIARELCERAGSAAVLDGSIAQIGAQYLLTLKAVNCASGESLASTEAQASDKNHVLDALGKTASEIRNKLGESLRTVQKFDTPVEQAPTSSLEALRAYSLGVKARSEEGEAESIPFLKRAIELDPKFAMAYFDLATSYANVGEYGLLRDYITKAQALSDDVSEREKLMISSLYSSTDPERAAQIYQVWERTYPRDPFPHRQLANYYSILGHYEKAVPEASESLRLDSSVYQPYAILMPVYT